MRKQGEVVWFDTKKGFGFIRSEGSEEEYYVHFSSIVADEERRSLVKGQRVEFTPAVGRKGPSAKDVVAVELASRMEIR